MDWLIGKSKKKDKEQNYLENLQHIGSIKNKLPLYLEPCNCTTAFLSVSEIKELVFLPPGINPKEWIALHTYYIFENVNLLYEVISEYCTPITCPTMVGAGNVIYPWIDEKGKKTKLSAPLFVDHVMTSIQKIILDENIFPTKYGNPFPPSFETQARKITRWLFQVTSHLYSSHYFQALGLQGIHSHLNTLFVHLLLAFSLEEPLSLLLSDNEPLAELATILKVDGEKEVVVDGFDTIPRDVETEEKIQSTFKGDEVREETN